MPKRILGLTWHFGERLHNVRKLLWSHHRDSDTALDGLRRQVLRPEVTSRGPNDYAGTRLYLADLVHTVILIERELMGAS